MLVKQGLGKNSLIRTKAVLSTRVAAGRIDGNA